MTLSANFTSKSVFDVQGCRALPLRQLGFLVSIALDLNINLAVFVFNRCRNRDLLPLQHVDCLFIQPEFELLLVLC